MCVVSGEIPLLLTTLFSNIQAVLCLVQLSWEDLDQIIKYLN